MPTVTATQPCGLAPYTQWLVSPTRWLAAALLLCCGCGSDDSGAQTAAPAATEDRSPAPPWPAGKRAPDPAVEAPVSKSKEVAVSSPSPESRPPLPVPVEEEDDPPRPVVSAPLRPTTPASPRQDELLNALRQTRGNFDLAIASVAKTIERDSQGNIIRLWLRPDMLTDAGCEYLGRLQALQVLDLSDNRISDAGLAALTGLNRLQALGLARTDVTDAGLAQLVKLPQLMELNLELTNITDASIEHLQKLRVLRALSVDDTRLTGSGLSRLRRELPLCEIPR